MLYTLIFYALLPLILLRLLWQSRHNSAYRYRWNERFASYPKVLKFKLLESNDAFIWFHTVSVGETLAAKPIVKKLLDCYPHNRLLITATTPTGSDQIKQLYSKEIEQDRVVHVYFPYDIPLFINRFLSLFKPRVALFMETEVWPNTLKLCKEKSIPTLLVNGRLSEKSFKKYQCLGGFIRTVFSYFSGVLAQSSLHQKRFSSLGAHVLGVVGTVKSDITIDDSMKEKARWLKNLWSDNGSKKIWLVASTHEGEEKAILQSFKALIESNEDIRLVLVPRHKERFDKVYELCKSLDFQVQRQSQLSIKNTVKGVSLNTNTQVVLGDTMGELQLFFGASDLVVMGGSFVDIGGHNMLEPAAWGLPIITGPAVYNFESVVAEMVEQRALIKVSSVDELQRLLRNDFLGGEDCQSYGSNAKKYIETNAGALDKTLDNIHAFM